MPAASSANDQTGQPSSRPSIRGYTSAKPPTIASVTLGASRRAFGALGAVRGRKRRPAASARSPTGTLTRKIARQPVPSRLTSIRPPPTSGPAIAARPMIGPTTPSAFCWPSSPSSSRIRPKPWGTMSAATAPWSARPAMRAFGFGASEQSRRRDDEAGDAGQQDAAAAEIMCTQEAHVGSQASARHDLRRPRPSASSVDRAKLG